MGQRRRPAGSSNGGQFAPDFSGRDAVPLSAPEVPEMLFDGDSGLPVDNSVERASAVWGKVKAVSAAEARQARVLERAERLADIERQIKEVSTPGALGVPGRNTFADKLRAEHSRLTLEQAAEVPLEEARALDARRGDSASSVPAKSEVPESLQEVEARVRARDAELAEVRRGMDEMSDFTTNSRTAWQVYGLRDMRRQELELEGENDLLRVEAIRKTVYEEEAAQRPGWRGWLRSSESRERLASAKRAYEAAKLRGDEVRARRAARSRNAHENISSFV